MNTTAAVRSNSGMVIRVPPATRFQPLSSVTPAGDTSHGMAASGTSGTVIVRLGTAARGGVNCVPPPSQTGRTRISFDPRMRAAWTFGSVVGSHLAGSLAENRTGLSISISVFSMASSSSRSRPWWELARYSSDQYPSPRQPAARLRYVRIRICSGCGPTGWSKWSTSGRPVIRLTYHSGTCVWTHVQLRFLGDVSDRRWASQSLYRDSSRLVNNGHRWVPTAST